MVFFAHKLLCAFMWQKGKHIIRIKHDNWSTWNIIYIFKWSEMEGETKPAERITTVLLVECERELWNQEPGYCWRKGTPLGKVSETKLLIEEWLVEKKKKKVYF